MDKDLRDILIKILFMEILKMERLMVKGFILGVMENYMMDSGFKVVNKVLAYGEVFKMIIILENGILPKHMDMGFINGLMEIDTKAYGK
jgi:hypothetical protein